MQAYGAAKARLFATPDLQHAIINVGDAFGRELARRHAGRAPLTAVWVGGSVAMPGSPSASLHADRRRAGPARDLACDLDGSFGELRLPTRLIGALQRREPAGRARLPAVARRAACGRPPAALGGCAAPPGRMEVDRVGGAASRMAVIDYAHTPDALAKALERAARALPRASCGACSAAAATAIRASGR